MQDTVRNKAHEIVDYLYKDVQFADNDPQLRDDVRQEVALVVLEKMKEADIESFFNTDGSIDTGKASSKLHRIYNNIRSNLATKAYNHRVVSVLDAEAAGLETTESLIPALDEEEVEVDPQELKLQEAKQQLVQWAMMQLLPRHRAMLQYIADGGSIRLYADQYGMEYNAAKRLWGRAKLALKKSLEQVLTRDAFLESGRMSPDLFQLISNSPHSLDILDTETSPDSSPSIPDIGLSDPAFEVTRPEYNDRWPIDHSSNEKVIW